MLQIDTTAAGRIRLTGQADIHHAMELHAALCDLDGDEPIAVDVSGLTAIDSAGAQALIAARRHYSERGLALSDWPDGLREQLDHYGLLAHHVGE